ncbi:MarR family winged helix-turn-helix transcriptional regulator [Microbacterium sp.]|uniref:MarR family winged helix-turn-helix transcriptional regulator n=1 Tax=Microbacterium sp. TaxID=51671 RepID=UPI003F988194
MEASSGASLASLLSQTFDEMVAQVVVELARRGHPGVTATLEFALAAIQAGAEDASALGRTLGVSKQAAAKSIVTLEQLGYVRREPDGSDARRKRLVVTDRGIEMMSIGASKFDELRGEWVDTIGGAEAQRVESALRLLLKGASIRRD